MLFLYEYSPEGGSPEGGGSTLIVRGITKHDESECRVGGQHKHLILFTSCHKQLPNKLSSRVRLIL